MKVYVLIEMWESAEDYAGNDLLLITKDLEKARKLMTQRYASQTEVCDSYSDDDSYISDWSAKVVDKEEEGNYYCYTSWDIIPYDIEE